MICSTLCRFFMGSTGFTPQNSHSTLSSFRGLDHNNTCVSVILQVAASHPLDGEGIRVLSLRGGPSNVPVASLWLRDVGGQVQLGMQRPGNAVQWNTLHDYDESFCAVMRYSWEAPFGRPGGIHGWSMPAYDKLLVPGVEGVGTDAAYWTYSYTDSYLPTSLSVVGNAGALVQVDEIRAGKTWSDVVRLWAADYDNDGVNDYREQQDGTDPSNSNSFNPLSKGLVAYYPFDGNANDESGYGYNGTVQGAQLTASRHSEADSAYSFGGDDWIETGNSRLLDGSAQATISAWVKASPEMGSNGGWGGQILSAGDFRGGVDPISLRFTSSGTSQVTFQDTLLGNYPSTSIGSRDSPHTLGDLVTGWRHIVVVLAKDVPESSYRIFVDGLERVTLQGSDDGASSFGRISYDQDMAFLIGAIEGRPFYGSPGQFWNGMIDDIRIYNRAFTPLEVAQLYRTEVGNLDSDGDGIRDNFETNTGTWVSSSDTGTDPNNPDTDGDGLLDGVETNTGVYDSPDETGTNPNLADTDSDGLADGVETASYIYIDATDTGTDPNIADSDGDGLSDGAETNTGVFAGPTDTGTNPLEADTSGDGLLDGDVVSAGYNPNTSYTALFNLIKTKGTATQETIGLFSEGAMMDLNLGGVTLRKSGGTVNLRLQIQSKTDLKAPNWTDEGTETFILDMPGNKTFMRIRALGPQ